MRYFINLGFDGTDYSGWQKQKNTLNTVQEVIEQTLAQLFKKNITVYGCGRTDAGVHASQYIIHIDLEKAPDFDFKYRFNKNLPANIAVFEILEVKEDQHARYDAVARTYDYFIHWKKNPILTRHSSLYDPNLNFALMEQAAALILKTNDFRPLCKQPDLYKNTLCEISQSKLIINEDLGRLRFTITSNRFLRGMVRLCVYFLLQVGREKIQLDEFEHILSQKRELTQKQPALPNGLFLSGIKYPYLSFKETNNLIQMLKFGLE